MRFKCGKTQAEYKAAEDRIQNWHPWFAWYPIDVGDADCRWLEYVEIKRSKGIPYYEGIDYAWEYRAL